MDRQVRTKPMPTGRGHPRVLYYGRQRYDASGAGYVFCQWIDTLGSKCRRHVTLADGQPAPWCRDHLNLIRKHAG